VSARRRVGATAEVVAVTGGSFDCQHCGACCVNPFVNRREAFAWYVEIDEPGARLLQVDDLRKRLVVLDPKGVPHMRLDPAGRCVALVGRVGRSVRCDVYRDRPSGCRRLEAGSRECLAARRDRGIG
jgi:Fe-S-cluster containining protein